MFRWLTRNWADTDEGDPTLAPVDIPLPPGQALIQVEAVIAMLPRWKVEHLDPSGELHATRTSRLWGFIDDVTIRLEPIPTGTRIHARSQSRIGKGDLGQNWRNLHELLDVLRP
jgi:uncharacterized protein (DUF1499 family)